MHVEIIADDTNGVKDFFSSLFDWTLYSQGMMALAVLVGVAVASGFTGKMTFEDPG